MLFDFQKHTQRASAFLDEIARELGTPDDTAHAGRVLTSVLHCLRDMITPQESLDLISQFPLYIKSIYVEGWKIPEKPHRLKKLEDFLTSVKSYARQTQERDFGDIENTQKEVEAVFRVIKKHISSGELKDIEAQLPGEIATLLKV
jgi:uncharacterized protein (DUF2267 family)